MESLIRIFRSLLTDVTTVTNFRYLGQHTARPTAPRPNVHTIEAHQRIVGKAIERHSFPWDYDDIVNQHSRSKIDEDSILADFFAGDIPKHHIPKDDHYWFALDYVKNAFAPPQLCRPCHIFDVKYHYPFKWNVNAEPPFSTDRKYQQWQTENLGPNAQRNKFGTMKDIIFELTRTWHHQIKRAFPNAKRMFRFPMLLHTKTAIISPGDPNKMRTIWGVPKPWIIADVMFYWEYLAWIKRNPGKTPMLWGYETITGGWFRLHHELWTSYLKCCFVTLDWKRFDKFALFDAMYDLMFVLRTFLTFDEGYVPTASYPDTQSDWTPEKARRLQRLWEWTLENVFQTSIILPDGSM
jgi:hypothetical protein